MRGLDHVYGVLLSGLFSLVLYIANKNSRLLPVRNTRTKSLLTFRIYGIVKSTAVNPRICHVM